MPPQALKPPHRKLVSVRYVSLIKPLASSETHEVVMVDGWPVVVEKGQFVVNQPVLYFALDCFIYERNIRYLERRYGRFRFSLFPVEWHGEAGWVVQTVKYEGHISQGMVFALDDSFTEIGGARDYVGIRTGKKGIEEDAQALWNFDLKDSFHVKKWSTFYPRDGGVDLGRPPSFLPTTKSARAQNIPGLWKTYGDTEFQITEFLDGIPMIFYDITRDYSEERYLQLPGTILDDKAGNGVCRRLGYGISSGDHDLEETASSMSWKAAREQRILADRMFHQKSVALAGVLCGEGILGNPHMIDGCRFYTYAMCTNVFKTWKTTDPQDGERGHVPKPSLCVPKFATRVRLSAFAKDFDELMKKAQGASCVSDETRKEYPSLKRKGLAFRTLDGSFSFKVIANDWLLDETEKLRKASQDSVVSRPGPDDCV